jgi:hypothetical protein
MAVNKAEQNNTSGAAFLLNDDELESLASSRGRKAVPSVYAAEVAEAVKHPGDKFGLKCTATAKAAWIGAQLRKGFKDVGIESADYTVWNREEKGFVAFAYSPKAVESETPAE